MHSHLLTRIHFANLLAKMLVGALSDDLFSKHVDKERPKRCTFCRSACHVLYVFVYLEAHDPDERITADNDRR